MTSPTLPRSDYYVYGLLRENGTIFYIGKGRRNRWLDHEKYAHKKNSHKNAIIIQITNRGLTLQKYKIAENLTATEALDIEVALILLIGRKPYGPLVNMTAGGDGLVDPSPEARKNMGAAQRRRAPHPPEVIEKMRLMRTGKRQSPETIEKRRAAAIGRHHTTETRALLSQKAKGRKWSPETLERARANRKPRPKRGPMPMEQRKKLSAAILALPPEVKAATAEARRKAYTPAVGAKISATKKANPHIPTPEQRLALSKKLTGKKRSDETRKRMSEAALVRSPEHLEKIRQALTGKKRSGVALENMRAASKRRTQR